MSTTFFTPLESPLIDPRNEVELVEYGMDRAYAASNGQLNDFSASSPLRALIEGQAFAGAELLYYLNQIPEALAIEFLKIAGIQRRLGSAAKATITFTLTGSIGTPVVIPAGFECIAGRVIFRTDTVLVIPPNTIAASVTATCQQLGTIGNVGAFTINGYTTPIAFVQNITNSQPASGGVDAESMDDTKARAFAALRRRGLVSQSDYEMEALMYLGDGAAVVAIGNLAADKITKQIGIVHLFCLNPDGSILSSAQATDLQAALQTKTHIAISVVVSSLNIVDISLSVIARIEPGTNPKTIADDIYQSLNDYLKPGNLPVGETVILKEIEYLVRSAGVEYVQSVTIGDFLGEAATTNYPLPNQYSAVRMRGLVVELVQLNTPYTFAYGEGDPD